MDDRGSRSAPAWKIFEQTKIEMGPDNEGKAMQ
jgi:hypothetical protein